MNPQRWYPRLARRSDRKSRRTVAPVSVAPEAVGDSLRKDPELNEALDHWVTSRLQGINSERAGSELLDRIEFLLAHHKSLALRKASVAEIEEEDAHEIYGGIGS